MTTGIDKALLRQLLSIGSGWDVSDYELDLRKQRCDVWVAPQVERGWFGRPRRNSAERTEQHVWRHLAFGRTRFVIHVSAPAGSDLSRMIWAGDPGMPFTRALAQHVFLMFNEGLSIEAICKLHGLSLNDVWKYRFAVDNGLVHIQAGAATPPAAVAPAAVSAQPAANPAATAAAQLVAAGSETVPDVADPVWMQLASGELKLDIRVLSLKLMLTKVRSQLEVIHDDEIRMLKLRDLHRYFLKNERALSYELAQIRG